MGLSQIEAHVSRSAKGEGTFLCPSYIRNNSSGTEVRKTYWAQEALCVVLSPLCAPRNPIVERSQPQKTCVPESGIMGTGQVVLPSLSQGFSSSSELHECLHEHRELPTTYNSFTESPAEL